MKQPDYCIYPTLLDSFTNYLDSDIIYERYWGWNNNPQYTQEEFRDQQFQGLIDRINRKPFDSEVADRGTVLNEIVDCMVEKRKSEIMQIDKLYDNTDQIIALKASFNGREFTFPISFCNELYQYYKGGLVQQRVEAILPTIFGNVLVYGVIDYLMPTTVNDLKTTGNYTVGKFKGHHQHLVYPYCLLSNGSDVRTFEYNIVEFTKSGYIVDTYTETYVFKPERDIPILTNHCEEFIRFLEDNKNLITNKKIFGGEN